MTTAPTIHVGIVEPMTSHGRTGWKVRTWDGVEVLAADGGPLDYQEAERVLDAIEERNRHDAVVVADSRRRQDAACTL